MLWEFDRVGSTICLAAFDLAPHDLTTIRHDHMHLTN